MTRVNVVPVETLGDKHLLAELREIKRIPNKLIDGKYVLNKIPDSYVEYRKGRMVLVEKFFVNRLKWVYKRYKLLYNEAKFRKFNVNWLLPDMETLKQKYPWFWNDWTPSTSDYEANVSRLAERIKANPSLTKNKRFEITNEY